ncbi:helix-turn-helix transcriptional regulator [Kitasatospora sp. NPDC048722]|uniref:helix-turn-helix transcriptional regulator n=1 Tax=Kitasatospora sp. NPDC048722 TaxID=3155639 RepID=UPI0033D16A6F
MRTARGLLHHRGGDATDHLAALLAAGHVDDRAPCCSAPPGSRRRPNCRTRDCTSCSTRCVPTRGGRTAHGRRTLLDLVEAALHTGRAEQARDHALAARDAGLPGISPRLALITYGALAMTADDDGEAAAMYARAAAHPAADRFPFELARIRLAHGIRVRRAQGGAAAREFLAPAADVLDRLGAAGWAARAQAELRAAGLVPRTPTAPATTVALTWQERRVADLAAGGLTNKEIGEQMRLSPRTVSAHLYGVFPKLGITTRAALRDAPTRLDGHLAAP